MLYRESQLRGENSTVFRQKRQIEDKEIARHNNIGR
jgi:hypothetical protein